MMTQWLVERPVEVRSKIITMMMIMVMTMIIVMVMVMIMIDILRPGIGVS